MAWATLWGRTESQEQMRDIRIQWTETLIEIDTMFEKVNALVARLAKRQKRLLEAEPEDQGMPTLAPPADNPHDRKMEVRRRIAAHRQPRER